MRLGNSLVESLTLSLRNVQLKLTGLPRSIAGREGTSTPWASTVDLVQVGLHAKRSLVAQGNVDETVVHKRAHAGNGSRLLATAQGARRNEDTGVFAPEGALLPLLARLVPEGLELCGEVAVAGGDAEEDAVEFFEDGWVLEDGDRRVLGRRVHLVEDVLREGLGDLEELGITASLLDTLQLSIGHLLDVAVHGVVHNRDLGSHLERIGVSNKVNREQVK